MRTYTVFLIGLVLSMPLFGQGQGVAFAFTNPDPDLINTCTVELFEEEGTEPIGSVDMEIGPRSQIGQFLFDMFPGLLTGEVGFVRVTCDSPICGVALQLRGLQMLQIPIVVEVEEAAP